MWAARSALCAVVVGAMAGCTPVPSSVSRPSAAPQSPSFSPSPVPVTEAPAPPPVAVPVPTTPSATGFGDTVAVSCAGHPGAERVIALLKTKGVLAGSASVTVQVGPLCAGSWQYTVLSVTGREPLQVVTRGAPEALQLVTAGTDVCSGTVRTQAPAGIVSLAHCV